MGEPSNSRWVKKSKRERKINKKYKKKKEKTE
jgi:hypothetical protein